MDTILRTIKKMIPKKIFRSLQPAYHYALALIGSIVYREPSKEIHVIAVTGTKGKSSVSEIINAIFEADNRRTAVSNTIHFKIADKDTPNRYKMTLPGRLFLQRFLRDAVNARCEFAIIELTSEGAKQYRHKFVHLDALVFTNIAPEHIESHGSFEKYLGAKLSLARALEESHKRPRRVIANIDDAHGRKFLHAHVDESIPYSINDVDSYRLSQEGITFILDGIEFHVPAVGLFNLYNVLAAIKVARAYNISYETIKRALGTLPPIRGRVEKFFSPKDSRKRITAVVDYAHTPDSLEKLYQAFDGIHKVCVLGNTGGGRDTWKRPLMGSIADSYCDHIILTNEDPYDEDPQKIVSDMVAGIKNTTKLEVIMDRRLAIRTALERSFDESVVLITGKGTDPYIMGPNGTKIPWSDAEVVQHELSRLSQEGTASHSSTQTNTHAETDAPSKPRFSAKIKHNFKKKR